MQDGTQTTEGLTADGRYVSEGNSREDLTDQIICVMDSDGDIIRCAEIQPIEFLEEHWLEPYDFDRILFNSYGQDWWLGVLYFPSRRGLLGPIAQRNMTEAGNYISTCLETLWNNRRGTAFLLRMAFRLAADDEEYEARIQECITPYPELTEKYRLLNSAIDEKTSDVLWGAAKRTAGGIAYSQFFRRVRIPKKLLTGATARTRYLVLTGEIAAKLTMNVLFANVGAMLRTYMERTGIFETRTQYARSWRRSQPPSPLELLSSSLFGNSSAMALDSEQIRDLMEVASRCELVDEGVKADVEVLSAFLDAYSTYFYDRQ